MKFWRFTFTSLIAIALSASLYAQGIRATTGNLYGKITDETGGVLPGVTVTLSGVGAPRTVTTGSFGEFRFVNIDPGTYSVRTDLAGFASVDRTNVAVSTGGNTELTIPMKLSSVSATVTVSGEVPLLDNRRARTGSNFSNQELKDIPSSRDPWGILQLSASIQTDNLITGANNNGQQSVFIGKGTNFTNNAWNIDGIPATDLAANGASPTYYDFDAFQEMQFSTGGSDPSIVVPGVTLNFLTKRGTNDAHGSARLFDTPSETEAFNTNRELAEEGLTAGRIANIQDYGVEVGGPVWKDHVWAWGSFGHDEIKKLKSNGLADNTQLEDYNVKINGQPVESNSITGFYFYGNKRKQGRLPGGSQSQHPTGTNWNQSGPSHFEKVEDSQVFGSNVFATASYSFVNTPFNLDPEGGVNAQVTRDGGTRIWHNSYYTDHNYRPQHSVQGTGNFFFNTGTLGHEIKFGGTYTTYSQRHSRFWPGDEVYTDTQRIASHNAAYPFTARITRGDIDGQDVKSIGFFLGDTLTTGDLTLNLGARVDSFYGQNSASDIAANPSFPDILPGLSYAGGSGGFHSARISPRVGLTYAIGASKTTLLRASYARFADQLGTSQVSVTNPLGAVARAEYQWNGNFSGGNGRISRADICLTCSFNAVNYDPTNPGAAFSPNKTNPNLKAPTTDEFLIGIEHQVVPELVAGASYTYRKRKDFIENCPLALDNSAQCISNSDYSVFNNGETGYDVNGNAFQTGPLYHVANIPASYSFGTFQTNRPGYSTQYNGVEVQLTKRLSNKWSAHGSFTYNDWKQKVKNVATGCVDPTNQVGVGGAYFNNSQLIGNTCDNNGIAYDYNGVSWINAKWQFAFSGLYQLPWNFTVSGSVFGHQGYPTPYFVVDDPGDGLGLRYLAAGKADAHRLASVYEADFSVQKVIPIAGKADITLSVNLFNAFNTRTILFRESDATDDGMGHGTAHFADNQQNPRVLSFGARVSF
ncbi:MAG: TonB-dependent receptor [Acidobacteriota bacterium]